MKLIEYDVEKLSTPPMVHDGTHPVLATDDDAGAAAVVALTGEPNDGEVPTFDAATRKHVPRAGRSRRTTYAIAIASAEAGAWETGSVAAIKAGLVFKIAADQSCAVRLYRDAASRDADLARLRTTRPDAGSGVLAETWLSGANLRTQLQSPVPIAYNADDPAAATLYWAVMNTMTADLPIAVTLTILPLE